MLPTQELETDRNAGQGTGGEAEACDRKSLGLEVRITQDPEVLAAVWASVFPSAGLGGRVTVKPMTSEGMLEKLPPHQAAP